MTLTKNFSETYKRKFDEQSNYYRIATSEDVGEEYKIIFVLLRCLTQVVTLMPENLVVISS